MGWIEVEGHPHGLVKSDQADRVVVVGGWNRKHPPSVNDWKCEVNNNTNADSREG
jgi:hypothetical protein